MKIGGYLAVIVFAVLISAFSSLAVSCSSTADCRIGEACISGVCQIPFSVVQEQSSCSPGVYHYGCQIEDAGGMLITAQSQTATVKAVLSLMGVDSIKSKVASASRYSTAADQKSIDAMKKQLLEIKSRLTALDAKLKAKGC